MPRAQSLNHAVLRGRLMSNPTTRELASGVSVVQFDLATSDPGGARVTVPVAWDDPPAARRDQLAADLEVVVVGWVRRRFFRANGGIQSRTEVVATDVVPVRRRRRAASVLGRVAEALTDGSPS